ncbi:MAG TPA: hypothetical protein DDX89_00485, partial [Candidatus Omnitrophica bacterium]|nr:hypothetical protein [Candidatus Omnitrophota bacterium]
ERLIAKGLVSVTYDRAWLSRIAGLLRDRLKTLSQLEEEHRFLFVEPIEYEDEAVQQLLRRGGM